MRTRFLKEVLFPAIEKESNGRLKIDAHWNAELANGYDALRVVGDGHKADMAIVVPEYTADQLPLHQLFKSFPTGPSGDQQVAFFRRAYANIPELSEELAKNNLKTIFLATGYPVAFFSTKPVTNLEKLGGTRWRSASFWHLDYLRNTGAMPVTIPWGEGVFRAMENGELNGLMVNVDSGYDLNIHKTAPYVLTSKNLWLGHLYLLVMNQDAWNGLSEEDQSAIQRATETAYLALGATMDKEYDAMLDVLKQAGANVRILDQRELADWEAKTDYRKVQEAWTRRQEDKGVSNASTVLRDLSNQMRQTERRATPTAFNMSDVITE